MAREHEPGGDRQRGARAIVEERLGLRALRQLALLQPADEDRAEAAGADRERVREQHARRAVGDRLGLAHLDGGERLEHVARGSDERRVGVREPDQLLDGGPQLPRGARVGLAFGRQHVGAADVRRGPDRLGLGEEGVQERLDALGGRGGELVERGEVRAAEPRPMPAGRRAAVRASLRRTWTSRRSREPGLAAPACPACAAT